MFTQFNRVCLAATLSTVAIATPLTAQVSQGNSRPPIPAINQQTAINGNGNTVNQNVNLYYVDPRGRTFPNSAVPSSNRLHQSISPSIIRTPANLPNASSRNNQNFIRH
ncbi:hypothetical protein J0895_17465 [Phormidium pseudopriestleyi FRX01]|uniref:Uncharacterized protein n=1 Tax=Phormidium pseudopriestleyi FRX01 TaxID=1759528 RepID=A0ABS3FUM2_9CYAN|nr:hypothetical protein [Phormidium pseudopriestleyi]MBO0350821.1 hypothetical protein [Phormidium pseudopriestleyi FRX01]